MACRAYRRTGADRHSTDRCMMSGTEAWDVVVRGMRVTEQEMFRRKRFERFSGCFRCGVPQGLCGRWRAGDEDGGRFQAVAEGRCQHKGALVAMYVGLSVRAGERREEAARQRIGFAGDARGAEWYTWLGGRVR